MRVLVTGAEGFVARHLVPHLLARGHAVVGATLAAPAEPLPIPRRSLDVADAAACAAALRDERPTHVVHLAAVSSVKFSLDHPEETERINVGGARNMLMAARALAAPPRVLLIGSADEYGINDGRPLTERPVSALHPTSPYAHSKVDVERLVEAEPSFRAMTIRTRSFPHLGPGQSTLAVTAYVASMIVAIERGEHRPVLPVGDLDVIRDYTDVRDVVRAYLLLLERGAPGEVYNVCSGRGVTIRTLLERLIALSCVQLRVEPDATRLRRGEIPKLVGDSTKLQQTTGWRPIIPLEDSLRDILAWWRTAARAPAAQQRGPPA